MINIAENEIKIKREDDGLQKLAEAGARIEAENKQNEQIIDELREKSKEAEANLRNKINGNHDDKAIFGAMQKEYETTKDLDALKEKINVLLPAEEIERRLVLKAFGDAENKDGTWDKGKLKNAIDKIIAQNKLPPIINGKTFCNNLLPKMPELIQGVLHKGCKLSLSGGSKSYKTWAFVNLAISVATGQDWIGFKTTKAKVLYLNFEIASTFFQDRLFYICEKMGIDTDLLDNLEIWNLRGYACDFKVIIPKIIQHIKNNDYGLIILDPIYKLYGSADENKAGDVADLLNHIEQLAVETGAAVAFGAHFSKGNQSAKSSIDRVSGSGVFARDPDSIITFTAHEKKECFVVESTLRNLAPIEPFVVAWNYPLFVRDLELDPADLKANNNKKYSADKLLQLIGNNPMTSTECQKAMNCGKSCFNTMKNELLAKGKIIKNEETKKWEQFCEAQLPLNGDTQV
jgi:hypothetical protein